MRKFVLLPVSLGILVVAYFVTFGLPDQVSRLIGIATEETASADGAAQGREGASQGRIARATSVVMEPLQSSSYALTLRTVGNATSAQRANVTMSETGEVVETFLEANAEVEKGDILLRLDDRTQHLSLDIAQAELDQARDTVERYQALQAGGNLTITGVTLSEAEVALRLAEANVGMAELALEERTVLAPISGRLGLSDVQVGDLVSSGEVIVTIDDSTSLVVEFEVPERSIGLLSVGKTVLVGTPTYAGRVFEGQITAFDSRLDSVTRSVTVKASIDNSDKLLWSGMTFLVRMIEETAPLPSLPATAVTWDRSGAGIWAVEDGRAIRHPVTILYREGDRVWLQTEIPEGTQIVTEGASKLREASPVTDADAPEGPST
ncbi:RND family efflux transporter, MFP subunit [Poseidonocella pacifica]|uniref:RND family efflux transporter, MFP subunit n=1 Tax=Poseidonocella pacifica TaxID=871651 RepID=A0A1I0WCW8_9RHOB|nr:efflux RND transporter periplasmic adaptor subunit [Poseidonocella pacifica]SFA86481.1 RND family efflux transporter, MFP subunit [Poseidonocella pacifica]